MFNKFTTAGISHPAQGSAEFDGASDYIKVDSFPTLSTDSFSVSGWFYSNGNPTTSMIFEGGVSSPSLEGNDSNYTFYVNNQAVGGTGTIQTNKWYFFACTFDKSSGRRKIYLDGSLKASTTGTSSTDFNQLTIGARYTASASFYFDGNVANIAVWHRELTSDEINSVMWKSYDGLTPSETSGLQAWYSLDDISGSSVPDSSGNGNNGTAY